MGNFCKYCGRALQEGEVCHCRDGQKEQENMNHQFSGQSEEYANKREFYQQQNHSFNSAPKKGTPRLFVPIGQTVAGGILILLGLITGGWDWSYISYVSGAGFLLTGICGIIDSKRK